MEHSYIDEHAIAERYLSRSLAPEDRDGFERHLVDCQECADRIMLANMFRAHQRNGINHAVEGPPAALIVRFKPLQLMWMLLVSVLLLGAIVFVVLRVFARA
jgi:hypothetical protein